MSKVLCVNTSVSALEGTAKKYLDLIAQMLYLHTQRKILFGQFNQK